MRTIFRRLFDRIRANLTRFDEHPLSTATLVIILFLDVFILVSILNGLSKHTLQLTAPDEYIPRICREVVLDQRWNSTNRIESISSIALPYATSYYEVEQEKRDLHPLCAPHVVVLDRIKQEKDLTRALELRATYSAESMKLQEEIASQKGAYDTSLLETIAGQGEGQVNVDAVKAAIQNKTDALNTLTVQIATVDRTIEAHELVKLLVQLFASIREQDRETLRSDLRKLIFWFPIKKLAMQLLFLLPLFVVFYVWNAASVRNRRSVQTLVSSHLLVVSFVPIFFKIIEAIYDIIPKKILKQLIGLLESLKLVGIWYYLVIALAVAAALFLIYLFQKKLFSREKMLERSISKGLCQECGRRLPPGSPACPFCGYLQFRSCQTCGKSTHVYGRHCRECGAQLQ